MPELPEVETVARQLDHILRDKQIREIHILKEKSWSGDVQLILNQPILQVNRQAKILRISLASEQNLLIHLKMSGQLIYVDGEFRVGGGHPTADWIQELPSKHTRIIFHFTDGTTLFFNDQRIFGWVKQLSTESVKQIFRDLSPDIIDPIITPTYLLEKAACHAIPIKQFIMDNQVVSGVGNIYANDALNLAKISPFRPAKSLTVSEMKMLYQAMLTVIRLGIELGGATSDQKYVHVNGLAGRYQEVMRVYQKTGLPCPNCGHPILNAKIGGRGTFYCDHCQK